MNLEYETKPRIQRLGCILNLWQKRLIIKLKPKCDTSQRRRQAHSSLHATQPRRIVADTDSRDSFLTVRGWNPSGAIVLAAPSDYFNCV